MPQHQDRRSSTQLTLQAAFLQTALAVPPTAAGPIDVVDLFCGVGGFSEGARQAGHRVVLAVDSNKSALEGHVESHYGGGGTSHPGWSAPLGYPITLMGCVTSGGGGGVVVAMACFSPSPFCLACAPVSSRPSSLRPSPFPFFCAPHRPLLPVPNAVTG